MRVNVYAEELTGQVELVRKPVNQEIFRGIRMYLASPESLHHSPDDNDQSAVTIWVPWTREGGHDFDKVITLLHHMQRELMEERKVYLAKRGSR